MYICKRDSKKKIKERSEREKVKKEKKKEKREKNREKSRKINKKGNIFTYNLFHSFIINECISIHVLSEEKLCEVVLKVVDLCFKHIKSFES